MESLVLDIDIIINCKVVKINSFFVIINVKFVPNYAKL